MKFIPVVLSLVILFTACEKNDDTPDHKRLLKTGLYKGTFHRTGMDTVNVSISILEENFEGSSDRQLYPAICKGSYEMEESMINFHDSCTWQANFDWTLILNGRYELNIDDSDILIRRNNGTTVDEYRLKRLSR